MLEIMRLLREIHAAVCMGEQGKNIRGPGKRKKFRHIILESMEPGRSYIAENFVDVVKGSGIETTIDGINNALIVLAKEKEITRIRSGIYQMNALEQKEETEL